MLESGDANMIEGVFEFSEKNAREVMTPRTEIDALSLDTTLSPNLAAARAPVASLGGSGGYTLGSWGLANDHVDRFFAAAASFGSSPDPALNAAATVASQAVRVQRLLAPISAAPPDGVQYPDGDYGDSLSAWQLLWSRLNPRTPTLLVPGIHDPHDDICKTWMTGTGRPCAASILIRLPPW